MLPIHIIAASTDEEKPTGKPTSEIRCANGIVRVESSDKISYRRGEEWCARTKSDGTYTHGGIAKVPFPARRFAALEKKFEGE
jgi:hypothetical protein